MTLDNAVLFHVHTAPNGAGKKKILFLLTKNFLLQSNIVTIMLTGWGFVSKKRIFFFPVITVFSLGHTLITRWISASDEFGKWD